MNGTPWRRTVQKGTDIADVMQATSDRDAFFGLGGADTLDGGEVMDDLRGGDGNDQLFGGAGHDTINGGAGNDTLNGGTALTPTSSPRRAGRMWWSAALTRGREPSITSASKTASCRAGYRSPTRPRRDGHLRHERLDPAGRRHDLSDGAGRLHVQRHRGRRLRQQSCHLDDGSRLPVRLTLLGWALAARPGRRGDIE